MRLARMRVWGTRACFTRPECHTERLSYPVMTPSSARGILEAVLRRPQFYWMIREIWVLKPIQYFSEMRNEVADSSVPQKYTEDMVGAMQRFYSSPYYTDQRRLQRLTTGLSDVDYVIVAEPVPESGGPIERNKYLDMFDKRLTLGSCFHRPSLGQRDWVAYFSHVAGNVSPLPFDMRVGRLLFDFEYPPEGKLGAARPVTYEAQIKQGIMKVPTELYNQTRRDFVEGQG